jgi:molybdopterin/thiamine biosynthesis adenylyltransferase
MPTAIDTTRHIDVFSPDSLGNARIDVIGAGATGSRVVLSLAKLGLENIHVWDFDIVESHNIANQAFRLGDIGRLKVEALQDLVLEATGTKINIHNEKVDGSQKLGEIVFLLVDSMAARKEIWQKAVRNKIRVKLMIETRMGTDSGRIYTILPMDPQQIAKYEDNLYEDVEAEVSSCGTSISVGPTAELISGMAVWQLIRWTAISKHGKEDTLNPEILFGLRPAYTLVSGD